MTGWEIHDKITKALSTSVDDLAESSGIADIYLLDKIGLNKGRWENDVNLPVSFEEDIVKLQNHVPIQYVTGIAWFYGFAFDVSGDVLIPRPETEELVALALDYIPMNQGYKILDIGTGSGCIPITLKRKRPNAQVDASDISLKALKIAKSNAEKLHAGVHFIHDDILNSTIDLTNYNLIISNPPYIPHVEKSLMHRNVLDNEPHLALFVEDHNPLIFYATILEKALIECRTSTLLLFEINEFLVEDLTQMLVALDIHSYDFYKDLQGKDRMLSIQL